MIPSSTSGYNDPLQEIIAGEIQGSPAGRISFERYMELALYHPEWGYYSRYSGLIGARGDFYTAPHLSPAFGELVGQQIAEFWQRLSCPSRFEVIEFGGGQGLLAGDILGSLRRDEPQLWPALRYISVEISPALRQAQRRRLEALPGSEALLSQMEWRSLAEFSQQEITGCVISNELLDSFPVHRLTVEQGRLIEIYVKLDEGGRLVEEAGPLSDLRLEEYFRPLGINLTDYPDGYRAEVNLRAPQWLAAVARFMAQGYILTIDYGYPARQLYGPRRSAGTLQCYSQHRVHDNPYLEPGRQDVTAHVDFTTMMQTGERLGLQTEGFTRQALFLAGLGLGERLRRLGEPGYREKTGLTVKQLLAEREALQRLINPAGMGNFGVLLQSKNAPVVAEPLAGFKLCLG